MKTLFGFRRLHLLLSTIVVIVLVTLPPHTQVSHARLLDCRSDPLVLLSDGTVLDISADIGAPLFDVKEIRYVLHIPKGLKVIIALSTPNWPTTIEKFTVFADNPPGIFTSTTTVYTRRANTPVTANFLVNTTYRTLDGLSGQDLTIESKWQQR